MNSHIILSKDELDQIVNAVCMDDETSQDTKAIIVKLRNKLEAHGEIEVALTNWP